jgi:hypothetical protein
MEQGLFKGVWQVWLRSLRKFWIQSWQRRGRIGENREAVPPRSCSTADKQRWFSSCHALSARMDRTTETTMRWHRRVERRGVVAPDAGGDELEPGASLPRRHAPEEEWDTCHVGGGRPQHPVWPAHWLSVFEGRVRWTRRLPCHEHLPSLHRRSSWCWGKTAASLQGQRRRHSDQEPCRRCGRGRRCWGVAACVLSHPSVACFVTHGRWKSAMEGTIFDVSLVVAPRTQIRARTSGSLQSG